MSNALTDLYAKIGSSLEAFKTAVSSKNLGTILNAVNALVRDAVEAMEDISKEMAKLGENLTGEEKHEAVANAMKAVVVKRINQAVDLPFINEDQEAVLIGSLIDVMIKRAKKAFNKATGQA